MIRAHGLGSGFSGFAGYLRDLLGRMVAKWEEEFEDTVAHARPSLTKCQAVGGDSRFALMCLTNARWRRLILASPLKERDQVMKCLDRLLGDGTWQDMIRGEIGPHWPACLMRARGVVCARVGMDEGVFDGVGTRLKKRGAHNRTHHASEAVWLLDQHLKEVTGRRRSNLVLLAELLNAFDLPRGAEVGPRWVEKRLELSGKKGIRPSLVTARETYHAAHQCATLFLGKPAAEDVCGKACPSVRTTPLLMVEADINRQDGRLYVAGYGLKSGTLS